MDRDLFSFLDWDPDDEERSSDAVFAAVRQALDQRSGGDNDAALATLDRGLEAAVLDDPSDAELAALIGTKAVILGDVGRYDESLVLFDRVRDVTQDAEGFLGQLHVLSRVSSAVLRSEQGHREEAVEALRGIAADYADSQDPRLRAAGVFALACRIRGLAELGRFEEARADWAALRDGYGADPDRKVRAEVAAAGKNLTIASVERKRYSLALGTADEVVALYRAETDPEIRAAVLVTMCARLPALRRRLRLLRFWHAIQDILRFIGSEPEPELIQAMRDQPRGERILRQARVFNR
jgi:tetratricopeptide (TPR) repeat protein